MGFKQSFTWLIIQCVSIATFLVLYQWHTERTHCTKPWPSTRGSTLPIPSLSLHRGTRKPTQDMQVLGIQLCRGAPAINYLLFADDSIIFSKAEVETNGKIQKLLEIYGQASGKLINSKMTVLDFSKITVVDLRQELMNLWNNEWNQQYEKYIDLPPFIERAKKIAFSDAKIRMWQKLQAWKEKLLFQCGKEILIKVVALSIPTYAISCFKFPYSLYLELESLIAKF